LKANNNDQVELPKIQPKMIFHWKLIIIIIIVQDHEINDCDDDDNDNDLSFENFKYVDGRKFINIEKSRELLPVDDKVSY